MITERRVGGEILLGHAVNLFSVGSLHKGADRSNQLRMRACVSRYFIKNCGDGVSGRQFQSLVALAWSSTIHGMSNRRGVPCLGTKDLATARSRRDAFFEHLGRKQVAA